MNYSTDIIVQTTIEGLHCWPDCPHEDVAFLKNPHRHTFYIRVKAPVKHDNRDIEFIQLKGKLDDFLSETFPYNMGATSCEMICHAILDGIPEVTYARVMEDNENGAEAFKAPF